MDTISLFQQPLRIKEGLAAQDFRDYVVFHSVESAVVPTGQNKEAILAWRNDNLSFVLIGKKNISQLMGIVQALRNMNYKYTKNMSSQYYP